MLKPQENICAQKIVKICSCCQLWEGSRTGRLDAHLVTTVTSSFFLSCEQDRENWLASLEEEEGERRDGVGGRGGLFRVQQ